MIVTAVAALVFIGIKLWVPALPALPDHGFSAQFRFLTHLTPWLVLGAIGLGNGGFFAYYSYVNPIMENLASVPASLMSAVITLAGLGMVCGNLFAAKLSRRVSNAGLACIGQGVLCCSLAFFIFRCAFDLGCDWTDRRRRRLRFLYFGPRTSSYPSKCQRRPAFSCRHGTSRL